MADITRDPVREIIEDFRKEIQDSIITEAKPSLYVINFRAERQSGTERPVAMVPIDRLRYRKENGRIASDVMDYECKYSPLNEKDRDAQNKIRGFLENKDPEKATVLRASMLQNGQLDPAIITCDGFLINGNRRKMVMEKLLEEYPNDERFKYMKVVILPGGGDEGPPPTIKEIETIENRYQLQSDGKSEYYKFDQALSILRKIRNGLSLEEQLRDDPNHAGKTEAQLAKEAKNYRRDYLNPLECIDRYLRTLGRYGQYRAISSGISDREGRWQAFVEYSNVYNGIFKENKRSKYGINEDDIGHLQAAAFNIIRLRVIPEMPNAYMLMRKLPHYCKDPDGKKELLKLGRDVKPQLPRNLCFDDEGNPYPSSDIDELWVAKNRGPITHHVKKAAILHEELTAKETPMELLNAAYKKLTHQNMKFETMGVTDYEPARKLAVKIQKRAEEIAKIMFDFKKNYTDLPNKKW